VKVAIQRIPIRDLEPNPYRHIDKYRIVEEKLDRLLHSYDESGFWDGSIQARPHPKKPGKYQIAFGHHRVEAARRKPYEDLGIVVADRDNATMLKMMASENDEEFKHSPLIGQETIGAVIEAYGQGEIDLETVDPKAPKHAIYVVADAKTYTCQTVARFLGWTQRDGLATRSCRIAFETWHAEHDLGISVTKYLENIPEEKQTTLASNAVLEAVKAVRVQAKKQGMTAEDTKKAAKAAAAGVVAEFKDDTFSRDIEDKSRSIGLRAAGIVPIKTKPKVKAFVKALIKQLADETSILKHDEMLKEIVRCADDIDRELLRDLSKTIRRYVTQAEKKYSKHADALERHLASNIREVVVPERRSLRA
jgi:hypothetical protein